MKIVAKPQTNGKKTDKKITGQVARVFALLMTAIIVISEIISVWPISGYMAFEVFVRAAGIWIASWLFYNAGALDDPQIRYEAKKELLRLLGLRSESGEGRNLGRTHATHAAGRQSVRRSVRRKKTANGSGQ